MFRGYESDVYCSPRCRHYYSHKRRYPTLGLVPRDERNRLAGMMALVRAARRLLSENTGHNRAHPGKTQEGGESKL
jgi:hypothetical protein